MPVSFSGNGKILTSQYPLPAALQMFVPNASVLELFSAGVYFPLALFRSKGSDRLVLFLLTAVWNGEEGMFHQG